MGLFDELAGLANSQQHAALYSEIGTLVNQSGGVGGLAQKFEQQGLGGVMSGWVGTGTNPAVSGQQIIQVLGQDNITALAAKVGLSEPEVASGLTLLLPVVINHLTPNGTVPTHSPDAVTSELDALKSKIFG